MHRPFKRPATIVSYKGRDYRVIERPMPPLSRHRPARGIVNATLPSFFLWALLVAGVSYAAGL